MLRLWAIFIGFHFETWSIQILRDCWITREKSCRDININCAWNCMDKGDRIFPWSAFSRSKSSREREFNVPYKREWSLKWILYISLRFRIWNLKYYWISPWKLRPWGCKHYDREVGELVQNYLKSKIFHRAITKL